MAKSYRVVPRIRPDKLNSVGLRLHACAAANKRQRVIVVGRLHAGVGARYRERSGERLRPQPCPCMQPAPVPRVPIPLIKCNHQSVNGWAYSPSGAFTLWGIIAHIGGPCQIYFKCYGFVSYPGGTSTGLQQRSTTIALVRLFLYRCLFRQGKTECKAIGTIAT